LLVAVAVVLGGCGKQTGGDPGNRRLHELSGDRVFEAAPPGATAVRVVKTPARYVKPGFESGGWHGPSVVVTFTSAAPPAQVYGFYARQAESAGWHATSTGALGLTDTWRKTYPDGTAATLLLSLLTLQPGATQRDYMLSGGVALSE
jgi:hypothetical protein